MADRQGKSKLFANLFSHGNAAATPTITAATTATCRNSQPTALLHHVRQTRQTDRETDRKRDREGQREEGIQGPITVALVRMCSLRVQVEMKPKLDATGKLLLRLKLCAKKCEIEDEQRRGRSSRERGEVDEKGGGG